MYVEVIVMMCKETERREVVKPRNKKEWWWWWWWKVVEERKVWEGVHLFGRGNIPAAEEREEEERAAVRAMSPHSVAESELFEITNQICREQEPLLFPFFHYFALKLLDKVGHMKCMRWLCGLNTSFWPTQFLYLTHSSSIIFVSWHIGLGYSKITELLLFTLHLLLFILPS